MVTDSITIPLEEYERLLEICKTNYIKNPLVNYYLSKDISNLREIKRISKKSEIRLLKDNIELENNNDKLR